MAPEKQRKPRQTVKPYQLKPKEKKAKIRKEDIPKTSAKPVATTRKPQLTLADWLIVYAYIDTHPNTSQEAIVHHFATRAEGALEFSQSALSRKLGPREEMEKRVESNPNALSGKRARVVTCPEVERALYLWVKSMESKGESPNGPMLKEKRKRFEEQLKIPEAQRLKGDGWIFPFCQAYKIKERRRHGEAGSVNLADVAAERERLGDILAAFHPDDRFNFDETGLFAFAPPDRGLSTKQMSGKKRSKFRITIGFACNASGTEKLDPIYIGKSAKPRAFKNKTAKSLGFYYRNNKKSWMNSYLYEEYIKFLDMRMRAQNRHIVLTHDNFSGHEISYVPRNITLIYFEPNMTSFVQPLDAGIIRCFKAHYRRAYCSRAIELDEAGARDIYKINILEAMCMAKEAWNAVTPETIAHCWRHTGIQKEHQAVASQLPAKADPGAWEIVRAYTRTEEMTMPQAQEELKKRLGERYVEADWIEALSAIQVCEENVELALEEVEKLAKAAQHVPRLTIKITVASQIKVLERRLESLVAELKERKRIIGTPPTLEEILNPPEELEIGEDTYAFEGGDAEIIATAQQQLAVERGEIEVIEVDSDESGDDEDTPQASSAEVRALCEKLESLCIGHGGSLDLQRQLRQFRGTLRRDELLNAKQSHIIHTESHIGVTISSCISPIMHRPKGVPNFMHYEKVNCTAFAWQYYSHDPAALRPGSALPLMAAGGDLNAVLPFCAGLQAGSEPIANAPGINFRYLSLLPKDEPCAEGQIAALDPNHSRSRGLHCKEPARRTVWLEKLQRIQHADDAAGGPGLQSLHPANETTNSVVQDVAKSLIMFYARPVENSRRTELEARLFRQPCRCLSIFPQLYHMHRYPHPGFGIRTGTLKITGLGAFVTLLSELTDRLISVTQVSKSGDVRAWRRRMAHLVEKQGAGLAQSFSNWLSPDDSEDAQVFALYGTLLELSPKFMEEVEASEGLRSAWVDRMHKLVAAEQDQTRSPRTDLIFHGAGCIAWVAVTNFNWHTASKSLYEPRFRACFPQAQLIYDDICDLLSMTSKANESIQNGTLQDVIRMAHFAENIHNLLGPKRGPISPLIAQTIERLPSPPNGWMLLTFHPYFHVLDRCSNHLRHSTLDTSSPKDSFPVAYKDRVSKGDRMLACSGCKASHYCSRECQTQSWKATAPEVLPDIEEDISSARSLD
ncbi:DDE superfamily endonuclease-domain-containing protein [Mycena pura]|uniref:DDE superfamily endonuclease-domain-containing protein n=1 Tax=Mycena pura TaxID=153505 RepID=A0AAD6YNN5_9AGAR|nr:DDE superfamily endonuclease-domain-containing protein [Mycena pura]